MLLEPGIMGALKAYLTAEAGIPEGDHRLQGYLEALHKRGYNCVRALCQRHSRPMT